MEMIVMYVIGSLVGLILTCASFVLGVTTLQEMERERWHDEMQGKVEAIR